MLKKLFTLGVCCFWGLCGGLLLLEAILYGLEQFKKPSIVITHIYQERLDKKHLFELKKNVSTVLSKNKAPRRITTNSYGLREQSDRLSFDSSYIFLGDSVVFGSPNNDNETIDTYFEKESGIPALNFGVSSYSTYNEYYYLLDKYKEEFNAKAVVLFFVLNDMSKNHLLTYFDEDFGNWKFYKYNDEICPDWRPNCSSGEPSGLYGDLKRIAKKSRAITALYGAYVRLFKNDEPNKYAKSNSGEYKPHSTELVDRDDRFYTQYYLKKMSDFCKSKNIKLYVCLLPAESQYSTKYETGEREQDIIIPMLESLNVKYIDLMPVLAPNMANGERLYSDDIHFTPHGHELIASEVWSFLKESEKPL